MLSVVTVDEVVVTMRELRRAERRGVPFTRPRGPWHRQMRACERLGFAVRVHVTREKTVYWRSTPAGRAAAKKSRKS